jgi:hypothetical protein
MRRFAVFVALLLATPFACEEEKPVDTYVQKSTASGATGPYAPLCERLCQRYRDAGCAVGPSCAADCARGFDTLGEACLDVTVAYNECVADQVLDNCSDSPPACNTQLEAWRRCPVNGSCGPVLCSDDDQGGCSCNALCGAEEQEVVENCSENGEAYDCECLIDGEVVDTCSAEPIGCAFFIGCCFGEIPEPGEGGGGSGGSPSEGGGGSGGSGGTAGSGG